MTQNSNTKNILKVHAKEVSVLSKKWPNLFICHEKITQTILDKFEKETFEFFEENRTESHDSFIRTNCKRDLIEKALNVIGGGTALLCPPNF